MSTTWETSQVDDLGQGDAIVPGGSAPQRDAWRP